MRYTFIDHIFFFNGLKTQPPISSFFVFPSFKRTFKLLGDHDLLRRGMGPVGDCLAPLQYRAVNGENDSMMNPFAKPWTPQVESLGLRDTYVICADHWS